MATVPSSVPLLPRPPAHASLVVDLARIVGAQSVSTLDADRLAYARDCWPRDLLRVRAGEIPAAPACVVWPETPEEVSRVLLLAQKLQVPVVPYGAGSGVAGGARPSAGGITIDLKRMRQIRAFDERNLRAEIECGIIGERLERLLNEKGFTLGHFPSSIVCSTLGGWLAARSAGQMSTLYGKIEDMTLGLEVASPGRVRREIIGPRPASGPDWNALIIGSEGTLGCITSAELRIRPIPHARDIRGFRVPSVREGVEAVRKILRANLRPSVVRLYDALDTLIGRGHAEEGEEEGDVGSLDALGQRASHLFEDLTSKIPGLQQVRVKERLVRGLVKGTVRAVLGSPLIVNRALDVLPEECLLIIGFEGQPALVAAEAELAHEILKEEGALDLGPGPGEHWLKNRYNVSFKQSKMYRSGAFVDTMEVAATWDRLLPMYRAVRRAISKDAIVMAHFSHAYGEGCSIYFSFGGPAPDPLEPEDALERYDRIWKNAMIAVHETGGTISHHHGVGELKAAAMAREHGPGGTRLLAALKHALDPQGILNPNKLGLEPIRRPLARSPSMLPDRERGFPKEIALAVGERNIKTHGSRTTVRPPDESALAAVLRVAHPRSIAVVTDQTGFRAPPGAVHIELQRFEGVARLSEHSLFVEVEAGVPVERLERLLLGHNLTLGHVHPRAVMRTIGAAAARNLLIRRGTAFGDLDDLVFAVRGLLANGAPIETRPVPRSATGPELDRAFIGAQGRLGIITKVTLRTQVVSPHRESIAFETKSIDEAVEVARLVLHRGVKPAAGRVLTADGGAIVAFELRAHGEDIMKAMTAIASTAAAHVGGSRIDAEGHATGGRFDAVVEASTTWTKARATLEAMHKASGGDAWLDFFAPEGASIVARVIDAHARKATVEAARALDARVVAGTREHHEDEEGEGDETDPYDDVLRALASSLDPTGVFRERAV
jgi:alkyldihydroxyacetonephosphate synthase